MPKGKTILGGGGVSASKVSEPKLRPWAIEKWTTIFTRNELTRFFYKNTHPKPIIKSFEFEHVYIISSKVSDTVPISSQKQDQYENW